MIKIQQEYFNSQSESDLQSYSGRETRVKSILKPTHLSWDEWFKYF
jgi:hypothetical protein